VTRRVAAAGTLAAVALLGACASPDTEPPPAPVMPAHWRVVEDVTFGEAERVRVSSRLGGRVAALRNTTYDVGGRRLKLNTIVADMPADAGQIESTFREHKSGEWFARRGRVLWEFVGDEEMLDEVRAGRARLPRD